MYDLGILGLFLLFEIRSLIPGEYIGNRGALTENFLLHVFFDRKIHF